MLFYSLLLTVLLSPLPFGTNRPWAWSLWALVIGLLSIFWAIGFIRNSSQLKTLQRLKKLKSVTIIFSLVLLWVYIQSMSPSLIFEPHPLWKMAEEALKTSTASSISLTPEKTITSMMRLLSYALVFFLSFYYCQCREKSGIVFLSLMCVGSLYSLYGLIIHLNDLQMILWFKKWSSLKSLTSTFVNHNHFATYAGLTFLCTFALISQNINHSQKYHVGGYLGLQRFLENLITLNWFPLLCLSLIGSALILTNSRGGILSVFIAVVVFLVSLSFTRRSHNRYLLHGSLLLLFFTGVIFYLSSDGLIENIKHRGFYDIYRAKVYALTWEATLTNPWLGFGLGSFENAFAMYKTIDIAGDIRSPYVWNYAHNTYLETLFELGIPVALALFYCFFHLAWICFKGLRTRKRDWIYPATGIAATVLIATHATVDFSMQIPSVSYTYCLLMGAACAQSFSSVKKAN